MRPGMINGWEDFFNAVELMRQYQKEYSRTKNPFAHQQCKRKEAEVDACIERRRQKAAEAGQKDLPLGG
jgi:DNA-binding GntR family transcriptional regulator